MNAREAGAASDLQLLARQLVLRADDDDDDADEKRLDYMLPIMKRETRRAVDGLFCLRRRP